MKLAKLMLGLALVSLLTTVRAAAPNQDYVVTAKKYLLSTAGAGWSFAPLIHTGQLRDETNMTFNASLEHGVRYRIAGQCDDDCKDLDIQVLRDGQVVAEDLELDDYPVVFVTPPTGGNYTIKAIMADCSRNPCGFAVGVLHR